ncbi:hypothetical protein RND81_02G138300 [Saponaria officinalis]|uniref:Uncharacterized protein n=1 Tax=Saponaria officinalis TaxID=3572 RepID=A0AAW1MVK4_SAPOF
MNLTDQKPRVCDICGAFLSVYDSWHDKAMYEQYHWKKAMAKKQPYKFKTRQLMCKNGTVQLLLKLDFMALFILTTFTKLIYKETLQKQT